MSTRLITKKELSIPAAIVTEVAVVLLENEINNDIIGADTEIDEVLIEVQFEREHRDVIHHIEDMISDYQETEEEEDDDDEEED
ncbi:hypothetical protein A4D02_33665 [Niastella koreensis]|uniref:Uncharacterized protein n=2 Tax=Niastella koreensis TaxID=354356 RepID=G8TAI0_NIAKG|nr:hypothetical protein [Niastella koreensis]AEV98142.1 hypothetical protein Niako_1779 [Niastella koreensis GR20-10]OQP45348.1 hypothetical protein A4D02_33665 [Niastella koreensis]